MKIYIGTDHAGFELKEKIKTWLSDWGYEYQDFGADSFDSKDDYPDFIRPVAEAVSKDPGSFGITLGGSGQGEAMTANRFAGVRAAVFYGDDLDVIRLTREHNNANILSLGARFIEEVDAKSAIKLWLETPFSEDERHVRRIGKIDK